MRVSCNTNSTIVIISALAFGAILLQTKCSFGLFSLYFPLSLPTSSLTWASSTPPLSRQEEKRQRWAKKVNDAIDQILAWRRRDEEQLQSLEEGLARARAFIREALLVQNDNVSSTSRLPKLHQDPDYVPTSNIYKNAFAFHR
ncbi:hypothetical protein V2J09_010001 [Rumex salicifolius]